MLYRLVPPRDTATSLTHTPWSTRLGPARSQHSENRMRLSGFEGSTRGTGSESPRREVRPFAGDLLPRLAGENQNDPTIDACPLRCAGRAASRIRITA
ncbi:hypothetical protein P5V15_013236 [Pogonomyrmex californicus]